jgi:hypothetical protein
VPHCIGNNIFQLSNHYQMQRVSLRNNGNGLTNIEVLNKAEKLKLPNFKYYSRDELVGKKCNAIECGVVNLDDS